MSTWNGWATDFLAAASLPNTTDNRRFMSDWGNFANHPGLTNNPVDLHQDEPGATNGPAGPGVGQHFQNYHDAQNIDAHTWARTAFNTQIHVYTYRHLLGAIRSGNPYKYSDWQKAITELALWGSTNYADVYLNNVQAGGPQNVSAPQALKGWRDLQHTVSVDMPKALKRSQTARTRALRRLSGKHKVGG